jgi:hypothetical protein
MGADLHVVGFMPADEKWTKMKMAWDACKAAGIEPPKEVEDFFSGEYPGDKPGREVQLGVLACKEWNNDYASGFEIDITLLPQGVRFIRAYLS